MERLNGNTILIGKEPGASSRLLIAIEKTGKCIAIEDAESVPNSVSRCIPTSKIAHAKIEVGSNGDMTLFNMKSQNITFVNGAEIASKRITPDSIIELGKDHFRVNIPLILNAAKNLLPPPEIFYNILPLRGAWKDYHDKTLEIQKRQREIGLQARIPIFFTMSGGVISSIAFALGWGEEVKVLSIILTLFGLVIMFYSFLKSKKDTSIEEREKLAEEFQDNYVCPNPNCKKFLGHISYKLLKRQYNMSCPHCKCKYVEIHFV